MSNQRARPSRVRPDVPVDVSLGLLPTIVAVVALAIPLAVVLVVLAAVLPVIPWWVGLLTAVVIAAGLLWHRAQNAHDVVLTALTEDIATITSVRLTNMVKALALAAGVAEPDAFVLNDDAANATLAARNESATIAITSGLLDQLEPVELEGVVAELLVRLRNGDAEAATLAAGVFRLPILGPLSALLNGPVSAIGANKLMSPGSDLEADMQAVSLTRYPPGLARALSKAQHADNRPQQVNPGLDDLWWVGVDGQSTTSSSSGAAIPANSHRSPLDLRIDVLTEL